MKQSVVIVKKGVPTDPKPYRTKVAQVSWETAPGSRTGQLSDYDKMSDEEKRAYHKDVRDILYPEGRDMLSEVFNLPTIGTIDAEGAYGGKTSPGSQTLVHLNNQGEIEPEHEDKINGYASALGLMLHQNAVAWHHPRTPNSIEDANGVNVNLLDAERAAKAKDVHKVYGGRLATPEEMKTFYQSIRDLSGHDEFAPIATPYGFRVLNFGGDNHDFHNKVWTALHHTFADDEKTLPVLGAFASHGNYIDNLWDEEHPNGEAYRDKIAATGASDLFGRFHDTVRGQLRDRTKREQSEYHKGVEFGEGVTDPEAARKEITLDHYSRGHRPIIDPSHFGTAHAGAERKRAGDPGFVPRSYYYMGGTIPEPQFYGMHKQSLKVPAAIYDMARDPQGLSKEAGGDPTAYESAIAAHGWDGYSHRSYPHHVALFRPVRDEGNGKGTLLTHDYKEYPVEKVKEEGKPVKKSLVIVRSDAPAARTSPGEVGGVGGRIRKGGAGEPLEEGAGTPVERRINRKPVLEPVDADNPIPHTHYSPKSKTLFVNNHAMQKIGAVMGLRQDAAAFNVPAEGAAGIAANMRRFRFDKDYQPHYDKLVDDLEFAAGHAGKSLIVHPVSDFRTMMAFQRHEDFHSRQHDTAGTGTIEQMHSPEDIAHLMTHPAVEKAAASLRRIGYSPRVSMAEIPAYIASGHHASHLRLTDEEAHGAISHYVKHYVDKYGTEATKEMFRHGREIARKAAGFSKSITIVKGLPHTHAKDFPEGLDEAAREIKHCGDYGDLFFHPETKKVFWVSGDSDGSDERTTSMDEIKKLLGSVEGVSGVETEAEGYPSAEDGWERVKYNGDDSRKSIRLSKAIRKKDIEDYLRNKHGVSSPDDLPIIPHLPNNGYWIYPNGDVSKAFAKRSFFAWTHQQDAKEAIQNTHPEMTNLPGSTGEYLVRDSGIARLRVLDSGAGYPKQTAVAFTKHMTPEQISAIGQIAKNADQFSWEGSPGSSDSGNDFTSLRQFHNNSLKKSIPIIICKAAAQTSSMYRQELDMPTGSLRHDYTVKPLDEATFQQHVRPKLMPGYGDSLSEYQEIHPNHTHIRLKKTTVHSPTGDNSVVTKPGDYDFDSIGSKERLTPKNAEPVTGEDLIGARSATDEKYPAYEGTKDKGVAPSRREIQTALSTHFNLEQSESAVLSHMIERWANAWAEKSGKKPEDWWASRIQGIGSGYTPHDKATISASQSYMLGGADGVHGRYIWTPKDFQDEGDKHGVIGLGPLSKVKSYPTLEGGTIGIPGGLDGEFTYLDKHHLKAQGIDPKVLPDDLRLDLYKKLFRSAQPHPEQGEMERYNRLMFGLLSPNTPLTDNEFAYARLRATDKGDIQKLAQYAQHIPPSGSGTTGEMAWLSDIMRRDFNMQSGEKGGMGIAVGGQNLVQSARFSDLYLRDPEFFNKKSTETWQQYSDRLASQIPGAGTKVATFGGVWLDPERANISAVDRHVQDKYITNAPHLEGLRQELLENWNSNISKARADIDKKRAEYDAAYKDGIMDTRTYRHNTRKLDEAGVPESVENFKEMMESQPAKAFVREVTTKMMQADKLAYRSSKTRHLPTERQGNESYDDMLRRTGFQMDKLAAKKPNGEYVYPHLLPHDAQYNPQGVKWVEEPEKVQVPSSHYLDAQEYAQREASHHGISGFGQQWYDWDGTRARIEPHEPMHPGLFGLPKQNMQQATAAMGLHKQLGYMGRETVATSPITSIYGEGQEKHSWGEFPRLAYAQGSPLDPTALAHAARDGRYVLQALKNPDLSSAIHEFAHVLRKDLSGSDLKAVEGALGVKDGVWSTDREERFARSLERYFHDGIAPNEKSKKAYRYIQNWMHAIYPVFDEKTGKPDYSKSAISSDVSPELRQVLDAHFGKPYEKVRKSIGAYEDTLFHGTKSSTIPKVLRVPHSEGRDAGNMGKGVYFTPRKDIAKWYAGMDEDKVHHVRVRLDNPAVAIGASKREAVEDFARKIGVRSAPEYDGSMQTNHDWAHEVTSKATAMGHDGLIWQTPEGDTQEVVAYKDVPVAKAVVIVKALASTGLAKVGSGSVKPHIFDGKVIGHQFPVPGEANSVPEHGSVTWRGEASYKPPKTLAIVKRNAPEGAYPKSDAERHDWRKNMEMERETAARQGPDDALEGLGYADRQKRLEGLWNAHNSPELIQREGFTDPSLTARGRYANRQVAITKPAATATAQETPSEPVPEGYKVVTSLDNEKEAKDTLRYLSKMNPTASLHREGDMWHIITKDMNHPSNMTPKKTLSPLPKGHSSSSLTQEEIEDLLRNLGG